MSFLVIFWAVTIAGSAIGTLAAVIVVSAFMYLVPLSDGTALGLEIGLTGLGSVAGIFAAHIVASDRGWLD